VSKASQGSKARKGYGGYRDCRGYKVSVGCQGQPDSQAKTEQMEHEGLQGLPATPALGEQPEQMVSREHKGQRGRRARRERKASRGRKGRRGSKEFLARPARLDSKSRKSSFINGSR